MSVVPPPLPGISFATAGWAGAGTVLAIVAGRLLQSGVIPSPGCRWLSWTGVPCPGCGATRCLAACGRLDLSAAWHWNPLVTSVVLGLLSWSALAAWDYLRGSTFHASLAQRVTRLLTHRRLGAAVAANWLYLCWTLPR